MFLHMVLYSSYTNVATLVGFSCSCIFTIGSHTVNETIYSKVVPLGKSSTQSNYILIITTFYFLLIVQSNIRHSLNEQP